jgi:hypothetical protein
MPSRLGQAMRYQTVALLLVLTNAADAASPVPDTAGVGLATCAVFGKEYRANPDYAEAIWFSWLQGYMSGLNAVLKLSDQARHNLDGMTPDEKKQYVRRFCNEHPLDYYITGAKKLFLSLPVLNEDRAKQQLTQGPPKAQ